MFGYKRRVKTLAVSALLVCTLVGCANGTPGAPPDLAPMWTQQFQQALADPNLSQFQRQVLSDYQITDAEYLDARNGLKTCMANFGWIVEDGPKNTYVTHAAPGNTMDIQSDQAQAQQTQCQNQFTSEVEVIYLGMQQNPLGLTPAQLIRACYQAHAVPDGATLSDDQFAELIHAAGYRPSTPEGVLCYWDPTGSNGYTIEQAEELQDSAVTVTASPQH